MPTPVRICRRGGGEAGELRATGMPLGLLPDTLYEEGETALTPGDLLLFYSDGLVEAHNPEREMFGLARLNSLLAETLPDGPALLGELREALATFTGVGWEQEDDVTLVVLQRLYSEDWSSAVKQLGGELPSCLAQDNRL
jgi:serine phosphatase RsbU (regulator of sigma subunit)